VDRNVRALIIALLCVLAVSLAAATLVNPQSPGGGGSGGGIGLLDPGGSENESASDASGEDANSSVAGQEPFSLNGICITFLTTPTFLFGAVLVFAGVFWGLKRRRSLPYAFAVTFPMVMLLVVPYLLVTNCGGSPPETGGDLIPPLPDGGADVPSSGTGTNPSATDTLLSPPVLLLVLIVVAVVLAFFVYRASGGEDVEPEEPAPEAEVVEEDASLAAVGAAAGAAADRIEEAADVDNEVYRAWQEMTTHIDVRNPDASTPAEFAAAASDAGMDNRHVDTLTALFRDVRYGGEAPTEDREQRAVEALRAIEDRYADGGGD
jgi:hypothetical protein